MCPLVRMFKEYSVQVDSLISVAFWISSSGLHPRIKNQRLVAVHRIKGVRGSMTE